MLHAIIQSVLWFFETKIRHLWCLQKYKKISNGYIGSWCVDTHLSWLVYLSSVQASLTSDIYPIHYGCRCILLPIVFKWSQPLKADNHGKPAVRLNTMDGFWHSRSAIGSHWLLTLSTLRRPMPPLSPLTHEVRGDPIMYMWCINLFTHLVHLPTAYASKTLQWSYALRSFKEIGRRLGLFETVRRALKAVCRTFKNYLVCNSC